eukprot:TRINITY_DN16010_c0_g1_i2.p1 TRINITY_DN16010_c0_g1~~TRINITY_DN16010_c0_g1_i2.p1  ORF type:complete len:595 (+),score=132.12 TRINITY_DN16010_c0_g1_i2:73-1785(+)
MLAAVLAAVSAPAAPARAGQQDPAQLAAQLQVAVYRGDSAAARRLLGAGAPQRLPGKEQTALMLAAHRGSIELASLLIRHGAPVGAEITQGEPRGTALVFAMVGLEEQQRADRTSPEADHAGVAALLLRAGARAEAGTDVRGRSALMVAAAARDPAALRALGAAATPEALLQSAGPGPFAGMGVLHFLAASAQVFVERCTAAIRRSVSSSPAGGGADGGQVCGAVGGRLWGELADAAARAAADLLSAVAQGGSGAGSETVAAMLALRDRRGRTALDAAVQAGDAPLAAALLRLHSGAAAAGAAAGAVQRAADGWHSELAAHLVAAACAAAAACPAAPPLPASHCGAPPCDLAEETAALTAADFELRYLRRSRPVLIRGAAAGWPCRAWTTASLASDHGAVPLDTGAVPYPAQYGLPSRERTLASFAADSTGFPALHDAAAPGAPREVAFTNRLHAVAPRLLNGVALPSVASGRRTNAWQWTLGGAGSGSPPHLHQDALNGVCFGRKHWLLWPPSRAFVSARPAAEVFAGGHDAPLQASQHAGDVLYVPEGWGHAVLNMEDTVAAAIEIYW